MTYARFVACVAPAWLVCLVCGGVSVAGASVTGCAHAVGDADADGYAWPASEAGAPRPDAGGGARESTEPAKDAGPPRVDGSVDAALAGDPLRDASADAPLVENDASGDADGDDGQSDGSGPSGDAMIVSLDSASPGGGDTPPPSGIAPGDLLVTEVMFDPSGALPESQWFEIYNATDSPVNLDGVAIGDGSGRLHVIASDGGAVVPSQAYVVLVRDWAAALEDSIPLDSIVYEYGAGLSDEEGIQLADDAAGALSLWNAGVEIALVPYGSWDLASIGQSIELAEPIAEGSDQATGWCLAQYPWAIASDYGTPGWPSDCF